MNALVTHKLQKYLAQLGYGSRRNIEALLATGQITVNGQTAHLGQRVTGNETIYLAGKQIINAPLPKVPELIAYHKPLGEICSVSDPQNRPRVFDHLPQLAQGKWNMVGRLDLNTSGLLLFSDSGTLAHRLMHPSANIEREYIVRIRGQVQAKDIQQLLQGISLEDGFAQFKAIHLLGEKQHNPSFKVILMEGRNREVRRLWEALGYQITRLCRIRYGHIILPPSLKPKQYMVIAKSQVKRWLEEIDQPS